MTDQATKHEEVAKYCDELFRMVGDMPGAWESDISRAREIHRALALVTDHPYFQDKLGEAFTWLGYWHRPLKWKGWGPTPDMLRDHVRTAIGKLRSASW